MKWNKIKNTFILRGKFLIFGKYSNALQYLLKSKFLSLIVNYMTPIRYKL